MLNLRLVPVPILLILVGLALMSQMFPIAINSNWLFGQDPAYQYLFAGVDILLGNSPGHTDHPGTPLQVLIAATIPITWLITRTLGLTQLTALNSLLAAPEWYLFAVSTILLILNAGASYYFGLRVYRATKRYMLAIFCQTTPLLFVVVSPHVVYPTPESALFFISMLLMGAVAPIILSVGSGQQEAAHKNAILIGALCGLGFAVKITFAPMLGLLLLLGKFKLIAKAALVAVIAWLIGVLPIIKKVPQMFEWFYQVFTHTGAHGHGSTGLFNFLEFKQHVLWLMAVFPMFFWTMLVVLLATFIFLLKKVLITQTTSKYKMTGSSTNHAPWAELITPAVLLLVAVSQTIMVAKHVGASYMIPALPLTSIAIVWLFHTQRAVPLSNSVQTFISTTWLVAALTLVTNSSMHAYSTVSTNHARGQQSYDAIQTEINKFSDPLLIGTFNCNFKECALWFGMLLVPVMETRMDRVTPNFYHFDVFNKRLHLPGRGEVSPDEAVTIIEALLLQGRTILLISPPYPQLAQFRLEQVLSTPIQNLYRVTGMSTLNR